MGWDCRERQNAAGPCGLGCQRGQDPRASGVPVTAGGAGSWSPPGGALEGRWMWGLTIHRLSDAPTFAMRGNIGQAGTGQLACGPANRLLTSGWAGQCVPGPEGPSPRPRSASALRCKPPRAQGEAESPRPGAGSCPFQSHPPPVVSLSHSLPAAATLV